MNIFIYGVELETQKHGILLCLPKTRVDRPEDYTALTLPNTDFKLLYRITANRIRPSISDIMHSSQHCGVLFGAISPYETIAHAEQTNTSTYIL
jgi:hypothetical protein